MKLLRLANVQDNRTAGASRTMHYTGDEFQRRGHVVDYIFSSGFQSKGPRQIHRYTDALEANRLVTEKLRQGHQYDLIEIHEPSAALYAKRRRGNRHLPPLVVFSYGLEERSYEAMISYRRRKGIKMSIKSRLTSWLLAQQGAYSVRHADHLVCSNAADVAFLVSQGIPENTMTRHFSGVEAKFLESPPAAASDNRKRILFMGTWIERKGILDLVQAATTLFARDADMTLTLGGTIADSDEVLSGFPPEFRPRIRVRSRIEGTKALIELYSAHGVFVLPSYFEGQPLSLIEAAAVGLVPVVTDIGGSRDFVTDNVNGLVIPVGDPDALAERLLSLVSSPDRVAELAGAARWSAARQTWGASAENLLRSYSTLLSRESNLSRWNPLL
jgi:glycosyltransferase involved in cell wall biosynthesis